MSAIIMTIRSIYMYSEKKKICMNKKSVWGHIIWWRWQKKRWCMHNQLERKKKREERNSYIFIWLVTNNDCKYRIWCNVLVWGLQQVFFYLGFWNLFFLEEFDHMSIEIDEKRNGYFFMSLFCYGFGQLLFFTLV